MIRNVGEPTSATQIEGSNQPLDRCTWLLAILAGPLVWLLLFLLNPEWPYTYIGNVDGWAYFGLCLDPVGMRRAFPDHPAGDILPLIWSGAVFHYFLSPFWANFMLKLSLFSSTVTMLFIVFRNDFGTRSACIATCYLITYKYFLIAVGNDYTDGRVIVLYTLTLFMLSQSLRYRAWESVLLFCAGLSFALCVSTAILCVIYAPVLALYSIGQRLILGEKWFRPKVDWLPALGFGIGILILSLLHWSYTGSLLYFSNTLGKLMQFMESNRIHHPLKWGIFSWADIWPLIIFFFGLVILIYYAARKRLRELDAHFLLGLALNAITLFLLFYLELVKNQETVSNYPYFNQSLPMFFLMVAGLCKVFQIDRLSRNFFVSLLLGAFCLNIVIFALPRYTGPDFAKIVVAIAIPLASALTLARFWDLRMAVQAGLLALYIGVNSFIQHGVYLDSRFGVNSLVHSRRTALEATSKWCALAREIDPTRSAYLWYDAGDVKRLGPLYKQLSSASHLWQGRILNEAFPAINVPIGEVGTVDIHKLSREKIPLLVLTEDEDLSRTQQSLSQAGLKFSQAERHRFVDDRLAFWVFKGLLIAH